MWFPSVPKACAAKACAYRARPRRSDRHPRPPATRPTPHLAVTLEARGVPVQDIRLVLRHHQVATTQTYLDDNPLRVHQRMRNFTIGLSTSYTAVISERSAEWGTHNGSSLAKTWGCWSPRRLFEVDDELAAHDVGEAVV